MLVERLARQLRIEPEIRLVKVADPDAAVELRFLGSPTVRVDGVDVEPGAEERRDFALSPVASTAAKAAPLSSPMRAGSATP
jgi:hypothetical protein